MKLSRSDNCSNPIGNLWLPSRSEVTQSAVSWIYVAVVTKCKACCHSCFVAICHGAGVAPGQLCAFCSCSEVQLFHGQMHSCSGFPPLLFRIILLNLCRIGNVTISYNWCYDFDSIPVYSHSELGAASGSGGRIFLIVS